MDIQELFSNIDHEIEFIKARGHKNIKALHKTTFEITREPHITPRGDCIIGVKADKAPSDFNSNFKKLMRNKYSVLLILLKTSNYADIVVAHGNDNLVYEDTVRTIVRKSSYVDKATVAIRSSKASVDIDRRLIEELRNENELKVLFIALSFNSIDTINIFMRGVIKHQSNIFNNPFI